MLDASCSPAHARDHLCESGDGSTSPLVPVTRAAHFANDTPLVQALCGRFIASRTDFGSTRGSSPGRSYDLPENGEMPYVSSAAHRTKRQMPCKPDDSAKLPPP